jgi:DNA-binding MarR family transcriptional regulator
MTRTEARHLLKQKATTRLNVVDVSLLHHLITAVFLGRGEASKNQDLASRPANIGVQTLAAKCGLRTEKAVCQHLRKLEGEKLITISPNPENRNRHVYTVHLEPMLEWESAATVATRKKKARLEARRVKDRAVYAVKVSAR